MGSEKVRALLAAVEDAERRHRKYSSWAAQLDRVSLALYIVAMAFMLLTAVAYFFYHYDYYMLTFAAGIACWAAGYVAHVLYNVYSCKAVKAARQACVFRSAAEIIAEIEKIKTKLGSGELKSRA
jgi:small-conductance mechanosensitive channel